jgi:hypothetical protein
VTAQVPEPCDVPHPGHEGDVRFYVTGWKCDAHSPWAAKGLPAPAPGPGAIYTYRAAHDAVNPTPAPEADQQEGT